MTTFEAFNAGKAARFGWNPLTEPDAFQALKSHRAEWQRGVTDFPRDGRCAYDMRKKFDAGWHAMAWHLAVDQVVEA